MADAIPVSKQEPEVKTVEPKAKAGAPKVETKGVPCGNHDAVRVDH